MIKSHIDVALPEETAGVAYRSVRRELIDPFTDYIGEGRIREHDWSLAGRIQTDGAVVRETVEIAGSDKDAVLVKGPGITPTRDQTQAILDQMGDTRKPEDLSKLATGTPNGYMRGHWLVKGNLERYANPGLDALLETALPDYGRAGKVEVLFPAGGRLKDAQCFTVETEAEVRVDLNRKEVRGPEKLSAGSPVYVKITRRADVEELCRQAVQRKNEIVFMSKYTVRPELDGEKKKIYNDVREHFGLERREGNQRDIVDAAFAHLLAHPSERDLTVLVPDPSYGPKIAAVVSAVYSRGLQKSSGEFSVCRFSAGKSEYGGLNKTMAEDGEFRLYIGKQDVRIPVAKGDMFEEMHYDYADAVNYVRQVFRQTDEKGYDRSVFAFDESDPFDAPMAKAVRFVARSLKKAEGVDFMLIKPDAAAVMMFTAPLPGKTCYAYDNLWGDIVSDAMDLGASIASVNSVILLADGRVWPEMGGAGTAPDLAEKFKREGFWRYDPVPVIEGMAIGFAQAAKKEPENEKLGAYADALHQACLNVLKNGISTPDLADKLKAAHKTAVDTDSFIRAVRIELLTILGQTEEAEKQKNLYMENLKEIR